MFSNVVLDNLFMIGPFYSEFVISQLQDGWKSAKVFYLLLVNTVISF